MTVPQDLIERVRKATGPDKSLDLDILCAVGGWTYEKRGRDAKMWMYGPKGERRDPPGVGVFGAPRITQSIDAALALAERVLPGWSWKVVGEPDAVYRHCAVVRNAGKLSDFGKAFVASQRTAPLAIVLATLLALQSSEQSNAALSNSERTDG